MAFSDKTLTIVLFSVLTGQAFAAQPADIAEQVKGLWQQKNYAGAQTLLSPLVGKKSKDAQLLALLGQTEFLLENKEQAEELLEKAIKYDASNADYQHWYATVSCNLASDASMFSAMGYAKRCKKAYETALQLAPSNPRSYIALGQFYAQAPAIVGGDKDKALQLAEKLTTIDPLQGALLQLRATDLEDSAVFDALLVKSELLRQRPESFFQRGITLARAEKFAQAIEALQLAIKQPATDDDAKEVIAESRYQLARCAVLGKTAVSEGIAAMQYYLDDTPDPTRLDWAKLRLAQLYVLAKELEKANAIAKPLLAATDDDKLKAELKKIL